MTDRLNPRVRGGLSELSAIQWLGFAGYSVFVPLNHSPDVDLVAVRGSERLTVEVKTGTYFRKDRWAVMLSTSGGNQSWNGIVKRWRPDRCDRVFIVVGDGRRWFVPASEIVSERGINLGGPKYAEFEVEPGPPLAAPPAIPPLSSDLLRRDSEAVKRTAL